MKSIRILSLCGLMIFSCFSSAAFSDAAAQAEARELLDKLGMKRAMEQSMANLIDLQVQQQPALAPFRQIMRDYFEKYMSYDVLRPEMVKIYEEAFTTAELKEVNAFYDTETGKKALAVMPTLMGKVGQLGAERSQAHAGELRSMIEAESARLQQMQDNAQ